MFSEIENLFEELQQIYSNLRKSINKNITFKTLLVKKHLRKNIYRKTIIRGRKQ